MKKIASRIAFLSAGMALLVFAGCGNTDNREVMEFEKYNYSAIAEVDTDSVDVEEDAVYWQCNGSGMLPVKIGKRDISALRDTLMRIAAVEFDKGDARPLLPRGYKRELVSADSVEARSQVVNDLSVVLMTPEVMVWRNYSYAYPKGAAHSNYSNVYVNYSLSDGRILTHRDVFKAGSEEQLAGTLRAALSDRDDLITDLEDIEVPETFYVTADGVTFVYGLYAIAPYSSGEIEVPLKAYSIADILTPYASGTLFGIK
ncbi:MAG: RsiV family protein [Muribaculaceae bacterium]|nr:RsiV family protein [Muribaculaceae bacterium]